MFKTVKLSSLIRSVQYGFTAKETSDCGNYKYLRITDIVPYFIDKKHVPYVNLDEITAQKYLVHDGDVLIARTGATTGFNLVVDKSFNNYIFASYLLRFNLKKDIIDPVYLKYVLKSQAWISFVNQYISGAAQPGMNPKAFGKFKFPLPSSNIQRIIGKLLRKYDILIETNNKRIAILEQEAEELYKEWFVRFRFPGYKQIDFKDVQIRGWTLGDSNCLNIPTNWKFCSFSKIGKFIRGKNITSDKMIPGDIPVISAGLEPSGFHNESNVKGPSVTISASGANAGYMSLHFSDIWAADCSYYQSNDWLWFAYCALQFLQPVVTNMQMGAAQPHVYPKHIDKLFIVIPDKYILGKFNLLVEPIFKEIKNLQNQNMLLCNQRDYLLPRLMSGKLEVK